MTDLVERATDALKHAYISGCEDVHQEWSDDQYPEFGEAASDYVAGCDFTAELPELIAKALTERDARIAELEGTLDILNWLEADKPENLATMVVSITAAALAGQPMPSPAEQKAMRDDDWISLAARTLGEMAP